MSLRESCCQGGFQGVLDWEASLPPYPLKSPLWNTLLLFSCSVMSDSWTAACQALCPSPSPRSCSNSCPLSWWCHSTISSSVIPLSFCLQSFPASGSFPMSQFFTSGGQNYWSFSISASNEYSGLFSFRIDWLDLLAVQQTLKILLQHHSSKT